MRAFKSIFADELSRYLLLRKQTVSNETYLGDASALSLFDNFLNTNKLTEKKLTEETVNSWISSLNCKQRSITRRYFSLKKCLEYLRTLGFSVYIPPIPRFKDDYSPYLFSESEINQIFQLADSNLKTSSRIPYLNFEFSMLLRILVSCGLRVGEALQLKMVDINFKTGVLILKKTKRNKQRYVPMHESLTEIIKKYSQAMNLRELSDDYLFPSSEKDIPLERSFVNILFKKLLQKAGISYKKEHPHDRGPCVHCLRHCFVLRAFQKVEQDGLSMNDAIPYLSTYLGHDSLYETEKYMKFSGEVFTKDMENFEAFSMSLFPEVKNEE